MVMAMVDRLLGREKWDPFKGKGAVPEPILVTMLPMPIQKAMMSPANRPTTAPCRRRHTLVTMPAPPTSTPVPTLMVTALQSRLLGPPLHGQGSRGVTHRRVGTGEEHPKAEESEQRPPHHAKDADGCLWRAGLGKEHRLRDASLTHTASEPQLSHREPTPCRIPDVRNGKGNVVGALL